MPWPYLSTRNKGRSSTPSSADDDGLIAGAALLSLEEAPDSSSSSSNIERRAASTDIYRPDLQTITPLTPSASDKPKARRSSFPRLALPSWRQSPSPLAPSSTSTIQTREVTTTPSKSNSIRSAKRHSFALEEDDDGGVELQEGYGTPYTATGLKGGFQCISPQPSTLSGSSSIASTSSSSRRSAGGSSNLFSLFSSSSGASRTSDEYSLDTQSSSLNSSSSGNNETNMLEAEPLNKTQSVVGFTPSPKIVPDSGFADFGPHTIVEEEERKKALAHELDLEEQRTPSSRYRGQSSDDDEEGQNRTSRDGGSNVTIPKKSRSKGWFSFNSSSKNETTSPSAGVGSNNAEDSNCCTPKNERNTPSISTTTVSIAESNSTSSTIDVNQSNQSPIPVSPTTGVTTPKKIKQSASSKGMNIIRSAGRKRGDSEVSMKDMTASLRE